MFSFLLFQFFFFSITNENHHKSFEKLEKLDMCLDMLCDLNYKRSNECENYLKLFHLSKSVKVFFSLISQHAASLYNVKAMIFVSCSEH